MPGDTPTASIGIRSREAARLLGVSERTLWSWAQKGLVPHRRIGRIVLFSPSELQRWILERPGVIQCER